jgi:hypothetical protein
MRMRFPVNWRLHDDRIVRLGLRTAAVLLAVLGTLAPGDLVAQEKGSAMPEKTIEEVLQAHTPRLTSLPGVVGVGESRCEEAPCILVLVVEKTPALEQEIGQWLEGYPINIIESGEILAREPE